MTYFLCFCWRVEEENKWKKRKRNLLFLFFHLSARQLALSVLYQLLLAYLIFSLNIWWKFAEIWWKIAKLRSARSRSYQRLFEFFLRVRWEGAFNSQFLKEKRQNSKKKEREKFEWKLQKSWFLRIFRLWGGPKEAISTSFWILSSRWRRMQPNLGPCEEINQKFNEILVKKFGRS